MNKVKIKDTLVAIVNRRKDLEIALEHQWYRIPVKTKHTPLSIKNRTLKHIAFYQTSEFGKESFLIKWYGDVREISIVKRRELLPDESTDSKANDDYFKISFNDLKSLTVPIISLRHRRVLFVNTTLDLLVKAKEFNDLFLESDLEEKLYANLLQSNVKAERQFMFVADKRYYYLDFALFCKNKSIDIECDGDEYHLTEEAVKYDKRRNNYLTKFGWIVLRYYPEQIYKNINDVMSEIKETLTRYGGVENIPFSRIYEHFSVADDDQFNLFT